MTPRLRRLGFLVLGLIFTGLGLIGAVLPVMPTTVFLIGAVACFARSSPRLEAWILDHPIFGPPVQHWRDEGAIHPTSKKLAVAAMAGGFVVTLFLGILPVWGDLLLGAVLAAVSAYVWTRPDPTRR